MTLPALIEVNIGTAEEPLIIPVAFYAVTSIAVIGLYLSFAIPIWLRWRHGDRFEVGSWNNGTKYKWMNPIAVAEIVIVSLYLMLPFVPGAVPFSDDFEWKFVNYAPIVTIGALIAADDLVAGVGQALVHRPDPQHRPRCRRGVRPRDNRDTCPTWRSSWPRPPPGLGQLSHPDRPKGVRR